MYAQVKLFFDSTVKLWDIPNDFSPSAPLSAHSALFKGHTKKVDVVKFNPVAEGVLASASGDKTIRLWDVQAQGGSIQ
jgi:coronin-1B/1C/6